MLNVRYWVERFNLYLGRYTYRQRFIFFSSIFLLVTPFPTYWMFKTTNSEIAHWDIIALGLQAQEALSSIYWSMLEGELEIGKEMTTLSQDLSNQEWRVAVEEGIMLLQQLRAFDKVTMISLGKGFSTFNPPDLPVEAVRAIWINFIRIAATYADPSANFLSLNQAFNNQISLVTDGYGFYLLTTPKQLLITTIAFYRLPEIGQLLLATWGAKQNTTNPAEFQTALSNLKAQLDQLHQDLQILRWMLGEELTFSTLENLIAEQSNLFSLASNTQDTLFNDRQEIQLTLSNLYQLQTSLVNVIRENSLYQQNKLFRFKYFMTAMLISSFLILGLCLIFRVLTRHILHVFNHIKQLAEGHFVTFEYYFSSKDEFYEIGNAFNHMARSLRMIAGKLYRLGQETALSSQEITQAIVIQRSIVKHQEAQVLQSQTVADKIAHNFKGLKKMMGSFDLFLNQITNSPLIQVELNDLELRMNRLAVDSSMILDYLHHIRRQVQEAMTLTLVMQKACDQTHLLGLNASIETVYTAPFSQAFAQTTDEVQRFADHASVSTQSIQRMINEISISMADATREVSQCLGDVRTGLSRLHQLGKRLGEVTRHSEKQTKQLMEIDHLVQDQLTEAMEVISLIKGLQQYAQESSYYLEGLYRAIQDINLMTTELQKILDRFRTQTSGLMPL